MNSDKDFYIPWYRSLQFKVVAIFLFMFLLILLAIVAVARTIGEDLVREQAFQKVADAGSHVISELHIRTVMASTLANALADVAMAVDVESPDFSPALERIIDQQGTAHFIAGGGVWPEPGQFRATEERYSFFWGRNSKGVLEFYGDYNRPEGAGYHHEEWYVPTRHLREGMEYWSKSYTDPHSQQPMVTVSVPLYRADKNIGAATIDLKLEGLQELLRQATSDFGGYAFAVDRNGRFLSFPDAALAKSASQTLADGSLVPFILMEEMTEKVPTYKPVNDLLKEQLYSYMVKSQVGAPASSREESTRLAETLARESYQIRPGEAVFIAAAILARDAPDQSADTVARIALDRDYFLNEPAFVSVTTMPGTFWQIVTVMPESAARAEAVAIFNRFITVVLGAIGIAMLLVWFLIRQLLTRPLIHLSRQLRSNLRDSQSPIVPIETGDRGELGALTHWFNRRTQQLLESQKQIEQLAFYDPLTGLPNRRMLMDRLEERLALAKRGVCGGAVLFLDLDQFKNINDSLGHSVGDQLLFKFSNRLRDCLREQDVIARIGGDEFVILLVSDDADKVHLSRQAFLVATKIIEILSRPFQLEDNEYHITASIGISLYPDTHQGIEDILKQADTAMYQAKNNGRNTYCFFEKAMQKAVDQRLRIEKELRRAVEENQLLMLYQPQVTLHGHCHSAEALVRWQHPHRGLVSPADFIPVAEESTLIDLVGRWVFREVCRQLRQWNDDGLDLGHIAINVSPRQFQQGDIVGDITAAIGEFGIDPHQIMLEITEGVILHHNSDTIRKMHLLKEAHIQISVDDFGTGYSSLRYLKLLPLNQLKIDQSFVRDLSLQHNDGVIVETILAMASHLGLEVIAEGVETEEQYHLLEKWGCHLFQGFYFCKPVPAVEFKGFFTLTASGKGKVSATSN